MALSDALLIGGLTFAASYGATWGAIRVHLHYLRQNIARAQETADRAHTRLDALVSHR